MNDDMATRSKRRTFRPLGAVVLLVIMGIAAVLGSRICEIDVASSTTADVVRDLPVKIGNWVGESVLYCQAEQCMGSFIESELKGVRTCPRCGARLDQVSLGERNLLPSDTLISRRLYQDDKGEGITVTIVLSGSEQRSIHRPQQCLPAQGFAIEQTTLLSVPMEGRPPLQLTLIRSRKGTGVVSRQSPEMLMAYWFSGGGHETPGHFQRLAFMAWDNLIHGIRPRWAYVSLQTLSHAGEADAERRLGEFVRELYPRLKPAATATQ